MIITWSKAELLIGITWSGKEKTSIARPVTPNTKYTAGIVGPPGPAGTPGSNSLDTVVFDILTSGPQTLLLARPVIKGQFFLNGLLQDPSSYTISGNEILVPADMGCQPNDVIIFIY